MGRRAVRVWASTQRGIHCGFGVSYFDERLSRPLLFIDSVDDALPLQIDNPACTSHLAILAS